MLAEEIEWLGARLPPGPEASGIVLNIGSSTHHYRTVMQPGIDEKIFRPLATLGYTVMHIDRKSDNGVDLVGDLADPKFVDRLKSLRPELLFCNNMLMHVRPEMLHKVIEGISAIAPTGSYLFVSGSAVYPHTSDPYDNGLRVADRQLANLFSEFDLIQSETVESRTSLLSNLVQDKWLAARIALRALVPIYRPRNWLQLMRYIPKIRTPYAAACAILRKA